MLNVGKNINNGLDANNNLNNNARFVGITQTLAKTLFMMKTYDNLWEKLCSYENLELAFRKARKHKTLKPSFKSKSSFWLSVRNITHWI